MTRFLPGLAIVLLAIFVRVNFTILPVPWPDEALFSSPAAELAKGRAFSTPVLAGLIYGMDTATLWNCPLHMVLLAQVYRLTGESMVAGRMLSLFLGFAALLLFFLLCRRVVSAGLAGTGTIVLALDPVFQRAANTIRMDMLTLLLFFAALLAITESRSSAGRKKILFAFLAGVAAGLAAISHPFAVILGPVLLLFCLPDLKRTGSAAAGAAAGFAPWGIYILSNLPIFQIQFVEQLRRKAELAKMVTAGETRGLHHVYFAQYGFFDGSWPAMIAGALLYGFVLMVCALYIFRRFRQAVRETNEKERIRNLLVLSFLLITAFAYFSSEGWYVVYGDAFLILATCIFTGGAIAESGSGLLALARKAAMFALPLAGIAFAGLTVYFYARNASIDNQTETRRALTASVAAVSECNAVYLRVRPDPYFELRALAPAVRVYEFIPGKLDVKEEHQDVLYRTWDSTECFLLDQHDAWEPRLTEYLERNKDQFQITSVNRYGPLNLSVRLFRRQRVH